MKKYKKKLLLIIFACNLLSRPLFSEVQYQEKLKSHINPTVRKKNLTFIIGADYTYWVPYQEGLQIAASGGHISGLKIPSKGNIIYPKMKGRSGFKIKMAANTLFNNWTASLNYTWFYNAPSMRSSRVTKDPVGSYFTTWDIYPAARINKNNAYVDGAESEFQNQFNRVDATIHKKYITTNLIFRPRIGFLSSWDSQYFNFNFITGNKINIDGIFKNKQNWLGIGPYGRVDSTYYITNKWGLFLNAGTAILLAKHNVDQIQYKTYTNASTYEIKSEINTVFYNVESMQEIALGFSWGSIYKKCALKLQLGWELQTYFSHGMMCPSFIFGRMNNYSMQGLTIGLKAKF